jgi:hypothetical protein
MVDVSPRKVLFSSILIPGSGHLWLGNSTRGLTFLFFMVVFGWLSHHFMPPTASFFGRNIGAIFVYGLSVLDAYKAARLKELGK